jgi:hypothetical protein
MRLFERLARLLDNGRITLPDCDRIILAVDPASVGSDRTVQLTYDPSVSLTEADSLAVEQIAQMVRQTGIHPALLFGRDFPSAEARLHSAIINDPPCPEPSEDPRCGDLTSQVPYDSLNPPSSDFLLIDELLSAPLDNQRADRLRTWIEYRQSEDAVRREAFLAACNRQIESLRGASPLQQKCRTCTYRNKDFDRPVEREHLNDLKCGINPTYAMTGVGECADFTEESSEPRISEPPSPSHRTTELVPGEMQANLGQLLINAIQAIPGVANINVDYYRNPDGWTTSLLVTTESGQTFEHFITPNQLNPVTLQMAISYFEGNIQSHA